LVQRHITFAAAALSLCAVGLLAAAGGNGKQDSQASLVRPEDPLDFDAKGTLRIREKGSSSSFEVRVLKVAKDSELNLWIEEPLDSDELIDVGPLSGGGSKTLSFDTKKGGVLPFEVESLDELVGRAVRVQHGIDVVLQGFVPTWDLPGKPQKATAGIEPPDGAPADEMRGKLSLRSKADKGQERIELKAQHVPWDFVLVLRVFVEDAVDSGAFLDVGLIEKTGGKSGRWRRDTKQGDPLPGGASFVSELAGRLIEVRRASDGEVFLRGSIPQVD